MEAARLAPTSLNQQKFLNILEDKNIVRAKALNAFYSKLDLGIVKYHFEVGTVGWIPASYAILFFNRR